MAVIESGASADLLTVDPTSKAGRVTLYDPAGNPILRSRLGLYVIPIIVRQSATSAADVVPWALWNQNGTRTVLVHGVCLVQFFDGTAAATLAKYELTKATAVTAFSGGAAVTAAIKKTSQGAPVSAVARLLDTGLTLTGAVHVAITPTLPHGRVTQTTGIFVKSEYWLQNDSFQDDPIELANQEALALRLRATAVIGDNVSGFVVCSEV